jgi:hypothetical protein
LQSVEIPEQPYPETCHEGLIAPAEVLGQSDLPSRVPVDDGVSLSADVYTPEREGRYPAVVLFSAYNNVFHTAGIPVGMNEIGSLPVFMDKGYVHTVHRKEVRRLLRISAKNAQPTGFSIFLADER